MKPCARPSALHAIDERATAGPDGDAERLRLRRTEARDVLRADAAVARRRALPARESAREGDRLHAGALVEGHAFQALRVPFDRDL